MAESGGSIVTGSDNEPLIDNQSQKTSQNFSIRIKALFAFIVLLSLGVMAFSIIYEKAAENDDVLPMKIRMLLPPQEPFLLKIGENRVLDVVFYSGNDDRNLDNYKSVNRREIKWEVSPSGVVEVDRYGTLTTIKAGDVKITVKSQHNDSVINTRTIKVVENYPDPVPQEVKIIDSDIKAQLNHVLQRKIMFFTQKQAINIQNLPQTIKDYILNPVEAVPKNEVKQGNTVWSITQYADGSKRSFVTRLNTDEPNDRDKTMYFMGNRYLPGKGFEVSCIEDDNSFGIWTANSLGEVSHIEMIPLSYKEKAYKMSKATEQFVMRHGLASDSSFDGEKWVPVISDNDGLWTSMYTVGELMRYASLKRLASSTIQEIAEARRSALKSLKAVLLIANVPCRNKTINARIRHYRNTRINEDQGAYLSKQFLMKNRTASTDSYPGSPADGIGLFGIQAGTKSNGTYHGGKKKYTNLPFKKADWSSDISKNTPATTKRSLKGFWARTFIIEPLDGKVSNQLYFKHNKDGTQTVLGNAGQLYDFSSSQQPILDLGQLQLPKILIEFLNIDGVHYKKSDLVYKGDTSTDEVVGHLFLYKVAFDVLQQNDQQEKELKQLVKSTLVSFCDMLTNNGYNLVDATGQGTKWGKIVRDFVISDFTLQDGPLKAIELLMSFKLCYYITGQEKWKRQYQFLINDPSHRYLDLISLFWKRWRYRAFNEDAVPQKKYYHLEEDIQYDEAEIIRHILHSFNFSDDQQAFLAFYLAFQLEDDPQYLKKYKEGIDSFWVLISRSENPLWYFMYQLSNPKLVNKDYYGNNILDVASWHLSRTNVDTRATAAFIEGSRKDVWVEGQEGLCQCSMNPHKIVGQRKSQTDAVAVKREINSKIDPSYDPMNLYEQKALPSDQRHIHKFNGGSLEDIFQSNSNVMQAATVYTLPYWLGVYHNMIDIE